MINKNVVVIGIGGCSRCGKTKLTKELIQQYNNIIKSNSQFCNICSSLHLDKYFNIAKISQNLIKTSKGHTYRNWEFPGALKWDDFYLKIKETIKEMTDNSSQNKKALLIIEGYLLFSPEFEKYEEEKDNYLNLFDYYIYICLDKNIAKERRMKTTKVANDYYDEILWPEHIKYCKNYLTYNRNKFFINVYLVIFKCDIYFIININFFKYLKENNKNILIIDGNKQYEITQMALSILKWINVSDSFFSCSDDKYEDIYSNIFTDFDTQIKLLEKHFSQV